MPNLTNSPYYNDEESSLPSGNQVEPGGLYMRDDEGALVFQMLSSKPSGRVTGNIDVTDQMTATTPTIDISAKSFKAPNQSGIYSASIIDGLQVTDLVKVSRNPLVDACSFQVMCQPEPFTNPNKWEPIYFYTVHDANGQLSILHTPHFPEPSISKGWINTTVRGQIYVQYNHQVYVGSLILTGLAIDNSSGNFLLSSQTYSPRDGEG